MGHGPHSSQLVIVLFCVLFVCDLPTDAQVNFLKNSILIIMFMYSYCYVCFVLYILP